MHLFVQRSFWDADTTGLHVEISLTHFASSSVSSRFYKKVLKKFTSVYRNVGSLQIFPVTLFLHVQNFMQTKNLTHGSVLEETENLPTVVYNHVTDSEK